MADILPIHAVLPELCRALGSAPSVVLEAPPGAGKSTVVPLELLRQDWARGQRILLLEPRRLAARAVAARMAQTLGEPLGETVGYRMRMDTRVGPRTRLEVITEGVLTRMLQEDASLEGVAAVLFDEFHERSLSADLGLALCLESQATLAPALRQQQAARHGRPVRGDVPQHVEQRRLPVGEAAAQRRAGQRRHARP